MSNNNARNSRGGFGIVIMCLLLFWGFSGEDGDGNLFAFKFNNGSSKIIAEVTSEGLNLRAESEMGDNVICVMYKGERVEVISDEQGEKVDIGTDKNQWWYVRYTDSKGVVREGYARAKYLTICQGGTTRRITSTSSGKIIFDLSDYNWGSEYSSIEEFKAFIIRAQNNLNFGGVYIQVQRYDYENKHWKEIVQALDEMGIPYGLYIYTPATTQAEAEMYHNKFMKAVSGVTMTNNVFPLMVDLEGKGDQSEVIRFYKKVLGSNFIVYANADDMKNYRYYEDVQINKNEAAQLWVAQWGLTNGIPNGTYDDHLTEDSPFKFLGKMAAIWQFTDDGNEKLLGTTHLDMNLVSDWWYEKYTRNMK